MTSTVGTRDLEVRRSRRTGVAVGVAAVLVLVALAAWYATHPPALPTSGSVLRASVPTGESVYLGVYSPDPDAGRTLHVSDVEVGHTRDAEVTALVCRDGSVGVTTDPAAFCRELVDAAGTDLAPGDQLVLRVEAAAPGTVGVRRPELTYRDGVQWGSHDAGSAAAVEVLDR